ncbi:phospho-N-acetylmuramoyl-pentapeptide-transferase [Anaplasma capra]|uniref:phospho-N-acetylmuramoyl-pentapeptide- transferase n=1 Tax=Anaplasma capra TaxID=1562740 RepID=UPI0021D5D092|nr:phospho-N-acetylmuramoyl-pentapeptide-transferase [Anaplasma capra]MCU7611129.1 phospho-N-acetylmuramoyl-pentapeptide-transferase [Anaplasma capra]
MGVAASQYFYCFCLSAILGFAMAPSVIAVLRSIQKGTNPVRSCLPAEHVIWKRGTPSMGGIVVLLPCLVSVAVFGNLKSWDIWVILATLIPSAILGGVDDYLKFTRQNPEGIGLGTKLAAQLLITSLVLICLSFISNDFTSTHVFSKELTSLGWMYIPFAYIVIVGSSNAVNLTDGLDGLATVPIITSAVVLGIIGSLSSALDAGTASVVTSENIPLFCAALVGSALSFLWFNAYPAKVFMGDLGSLPIGASLGLMSVMLKCELIFAIAGSVFVAEALSSMIQVAFKLTKGRKIFLVAPVHHHFEKLGLKEPTIVIRAWIIAVFSMVMSLAATTYVYR